MVRTSFYVPLYALWPPCVLLFPHSTFWLLKNWLALKHASAFLSPTSPPSLQFNCHSAAVVGYWLLTVVKPLRASCVLSPAASWQHSNKLLAIQLPCTQRSLLPFGSGPFSLHALVVSLIWTSAKSYPQIIHSISRQILSLLLIFKPLLVCTVHCMWVYLRCFSHILITTTKAGTFFTCSWEYLHEQIYHSLLYFHQQNTYAGPSSSGSW